MKKNTIKLYCFKIPSTFQKKTTVDRFLFLRLSLLYFVNQTKRRNYFRRWFDFFFLCGQRQRTIKTCLRYFGFKVLRDIFFFLSLFFSCSVSTLILVTMLLIWKTANEASVFSSLSQSACCFVQQKFVSKNIFQAVVDWFLEQDLLECMWAGACTTL